MFADFTNSYLMRPARFKPNNYSVRGNFLGFFLSKIFLLFDFYNYFSSHAVMVGINGYFWGGFGLLVPELSMKNASSSYAAGPVVEDMLEGGGFGRVFCCAGIWL